MSGAAAACASLGCTDTTGLADSLFPTVTGKLEAVQLRGRWVGTSQAITLTVNVVAVDSVTGPDGVKSYFPKGGFELVDRSSATASSISTQSLTLQCMNNGVTLTLCMKANEPLELWLAQSLGDRLYDRYRFRLTSSRSMDGWLHWRTFGFFHTSLDSARVTMGRVGEATP